MRRISREDGQAMIELMLLMPFLLLLSLAMLQAGKAIGSFAQEKDVAGEAARLVAVNYCPACGIRSVNDWVLGQRPDFKANAVLSIEFEQSGGVPVPFNHCGASALHEAGPVKVRVVWKDYPVAPLMKVDMASASTMRLERSWNGNPVTGLRSSTDTYDVVPGSASPDICP